MCVCVFCVKLLSFFQFYLNPLNEVEELCTKSYKANYFSMILDLIVSNFIA